MTKADDLRAMIEFGGIIGNDIVNERQLRDLHDFYCVMTDADKWRLWNVARLLATYPESSEVRQAAWRAAELPEPRRAIAVIDVERAV